ncbi:related to cytosolic Cu/Zn superoxide dismutase [Rhynchosporium agropyri]|uniref:superoxide dismutase n=1 Tax=Rhynchosporium agropyri TaxID=914238 RepID=A0A1E1JZ84_9HELO|nr:related to cytosolic Cu/Zn superoxide dismutase [Rhynchosporium agropyri]
MYTSMVAVVSTALLTLASAQNTTDLITGKLGNSTVASNNPIGKVYTATLPEKPFFNPKNPKGNIKGSISAAATSNGVGVKFTVRFENLPTSGGPFLYHLHASPVPADGNCTKALTHLDPLIRGETTPCNDEYPQTCQVGDLSGKYGSIVSDPFEESYNDEYASTVPGSPAFFGNRSFVIHFANKTRITCANFVLASNSTASRAKPKNTRANDPATSSTMPSPSPSPTGSAPPTQVTGAANAISASLLSLTVVFGLFFML